MSDRDTWKATTCFSHERVWEGNRSKARHGSLVTEFNYDKRFLPKIGFFPKPLAENGLYYGVKTTAVILHQAIITEHR